ncbi:hypothetical protein F2Q69_00035303 [Brassica cretica]|uniref:Uncharacterized protein n=1 Tax=Brassica cretica TaxID=69181 RepID=A0A8S9SRG3_BRACR|nr:hypothetical protein F2Q69_00035303 [Brassica cretica]
MGVLVYEEPYRVQGPIRLEPAASRGGCTGCKSKIDRVYWDMVPWPVRDDVCGLGRTDHDRDPYDLALLEVARNVAEDFPKVLGLWGWLAE